MVTKWQRTELKKERVPHKHRTDRTLKKKRYTIRNKKASRKGNGLVLMQALTLSQSHYETSTNKMFFIVVNSFAFLFNLYFSSDQDVSNHFMCLITNALYLIHPTESFALLILF